jgi:hypothetical protein
VLVDVRQDKPLDRFRARRWRSALRTLLQELVGLRAAAGPEQVGPSTTSMHLVRSTGAGCEVRDDAVVVGQLVRAAVDLGRPLDDIRRTA